MGVSGIIAISGVWWSGGVDVRGGWGGGEGARSMRFGGEVGGGGPSL